MAPEGIGWMRWYLRGGRTGPSWCPVTLMSELGDVADHLVVVSRGRVTADTSVRKHCDCRMMHDLSCG